LLRLQQIFLGGRYEGRFDLSNSSRFPSDSDVVATGGNAAIPNTDMQI
jgi:hypothetical protein